MLESQRKEQVPKWPEVASSISMGIQINHLVRLNPLTPESSSGFSPFAYTIVRMLILGQFDQTGRKERSYYQDSKIALHK